MLTGENGILNQANTAKIQNEIGKEKEQIALAYNGAKAEKSGEDVTSEDINNQFTKNETKAIANLAGENKINVKFDDTGNQYIIDKTGQISKFEPVDRTGLKVGDYVNYTYDDAESYLLTGEVSGYTSNQIINQVKELKWRILSINDDGTVDLVSENPTDKTFYFKGALGYNNGVWVLNDICEKQYSNSSLGITARSINLEDFEQKLTDTGKKIRDEYEYAGITYGNLKKYTGNNSYYPNLYAIENGSGIDTETVKKDGVNLNDNGYKTPTAETYSQASELTTTQTYYYMSLTSTNYGDVASILSNGTYWVASRYVRCYSDYADFGLRHVDGAFRGFYVFYSDTNTDSSNDLLRPVVTIESNIKIIANTGTSDNMPDVGTLKWKNIEKSSKA